MSELTPPTDTPIAVHASPLREQLGQILRVLLTTIGGMFAARAGVDASVSDAVVSVIFIAAPTVWGQLRVLKTHAQRVTLVDLVPDHIGKVV